MNEEKTFYTYDDNNYRYVLALRTVKSKYRYNNYFETPEEVTKHFKEAQEISQERYSKIMQGMEELKEKFGDFSICSWAWAHDDSGLEHGIKLEINVNGYNFEFKQN